LQIAKRKIDVLIAMVIGALIVVPQVLLSQESPASLSQHQWVTSWNIANIWRRDFVTVDGAQHYRLPVGVYYLARMAWPSLLFPLLALLCLPGALWLARRRRWPELALLAGWPIVLWLFLSGIPFENARFILPGLPTLAALAGLGFGWVYELTNNQEPRTKNQEPPRGYPTGEPKNRRTNNTEQSTINYGQQTTDNNNSHSQQPLRVRPRSSASNPFRVRLLLVFALAVSLAGSLAWGLRDYYNLVLYKNEQLALVEWTRAQLPAGSTLITFGATLTLQHYTDHDVRELFYLAPPDLDQIAQQPQPAYLLLDVGNIESQWVGLRPWQDYHYLQERPGLEIVGRQGVYTLFRLKPASQ